jgi:murein DD-endopeptidase MepM/ murein hydrolase activator NlpD
MTNGRRGAAFVFALWAAAASGACAKKSVVTRPAPPPPASGLHDEYAESLREAGTDKTPLGLEWFRAADSAIGSPIDVTLPFGESGVFSPAEALAVGYRFALERGQRLIVDLGGAGTGVQPLFVDLFEVRSGGLHRTAPVHAAAERLSFVAEHDARFILRIQPRFQTGRHYSLVLRTGSGLTFPVDGVVPERVADTFGASRDNGQRTHDGVDIFAPKGTPALAAADGVITRTNDGGLGGRAVWLHDPALDVTYYYAHLDRWTVRAGQRVSAGQTIGLVGNTGNASSGSPHLHFGVYRADGQATDPMPYLNGAGLPVPLLNGDSSLLGRRLRTTQQKVALSAEPDGRSGRTTDLATGTIVWVDAVTSETCRVRLPDGTAGFVMTTAIELAADPLRWVATNGPAAILDRPLSSAGVVARLDRDAPLSVLGVFADYLLVRTREGQEGWIKGK